MELFLQKLYFLFHKILNEKENKKACSICFEVRISRKSKWNFWWNGSVKKSVKVMITTGLLLCCEIWVCIHDLACPFLPFLPCLWLMPYYICSSVGKIFHFMLSRIASLVLWSNLLNGHFVITFFLLLSKKYEKKIKKVVGLNKALNSCVISAWKSKTKKHDGGPWAEGGGPWTQGSWMENPDQYRWRTKEEFGRRSPDMGA